MDRNAGLIALKNLQKRIESDGLDLHPSHFANDISKGSQVSSIPEQELIGFMDRQLLPKALKACNFPSAKDCPPPSDRDLEIATILWALKGSGSGQMIRRE